MLLTLRALMAWALDKITEKFSDAAADPTRWGAAMDFVAQETESFGVMLLPTRGRLPFIPQSQSMLRSVEHYVSDGWINRDYRYKATPIVLRKGVATDFDIISLEEMRRSDFYQELLAPFKLKWFSVVGISAAEDHWGLSIQRSIDQDHFQPLELKRLKQLGAHLASAATMARALAFARAEGALAAFDLSETAAVMLNSLGEVAKINERARSLLGPDIMIVNRRLRSKYQSVSEMLDRSIFNVLERADFPSAPAIAMPREMGRSVIANVMRANSLFMEVLSPARVFVLLTDPDRKIIPALADLMVVFELTRAEARLAIELQHCYSLSQAAVRLNTTYETARSTLKQVFRKTETSSQADLLRLISRLRPQG